MKKLEIKLRHFEELETIMDREKEAVSQEYFNTMLYSVGQQDPSLSVNAGTQIL